MPGDRLDHQTGLRRNPAVLWRRLIGGVVLLSPNGEYLHLGIEGEAIWDLAAVPLTLGELTDTLVEVFRSPRGIVSKDATDLVGALVAAGVLETEDRNTFP